MKYRPYPIFLKNHIFTSVQKQIRIECYKKTSERLYSIQTKTFSATKFILRVFNVRYYGYDSIIIAVDA